MSRIRSPRGHKRQGAKRTRRMTPAREADANAIAQGMRENSTDATENDNDSAAYEEHQRVKGKSAAHRVTQQQKQ